MLFFMVIAVATAVEDVSAAKYKQFDKGSKIIGKDAVGKNVSISWNAKSNGKTVKTVCNFHKVYGKNKKTKIASITATLTKISKTKIKYTVTTKEKGRKSVTETFIKKTKLTAKSYYNKTDKKTYRKLTL